MSDKRAFVIALLTSVIVLSLFQVGKFAICGGFRQGPPRQCEKMRPMKMKRHMKRQMKRQMMPSGPMQMCPAAPGFAGMQGCPMMQGGHRNFGMGPKVIVLCPQCQAMIELQKNAQGPRMGRGNGRRMQNGGFGMEQGAYGRKRANGQRRDGFRPMSPVDPLMAPCDGKGPAPKFEGKGPAPKFEGKGHAPKFDGKGHAPKFEGKSPAPKGDIKAPAPKPEAKPEAKPEVKAPAAK